MSYEIRDINLAESGEHKIDWVRKNCPLLRSLEEDFAKELPFAGVLCGGLRLYQRMG